MTLASLAPEEREVVRRTMEATFRYLDFDFQTRIGVSLNTMRVLLDAWPAIDDSRDDSDACLAINNSLNELLHGEGISEKDSVELMGVGREEMLQVYRKWAAGRRWKSTGVR